MTARTPDHRRRAVRFAWALLLAATALSVAGNVATAMHRSHSHEAVAVAVTVPLMLAATVHLLALMVRAGVAGWAYRGVLVLVVGIAGSAFTLSFEALTALAQRTGHGVLSPLLPVMIDAAIAAATAALVVLDRRPAPDQVVVTERKADTLTATTDHPPAAPDHNGHAVAVTAPTSDLSVSAPYSETAEALVRDGVVRADPAVVAAAVAALAAGGSHRAVAAASGLHRTSVARVAAAVGSGD